MRVGFLSFSFVSVFYFCYYVLIQFKDQTIFKIHENNCVNQMDLSKATRQFPELLNIYLSYNKYRSNSNIYWINSKAQNKYVKPSKNIGLNFTSCQYFYKITGTFPWTHLKRFLMLIISEVISEGFN